MTTNPLLSVIIAAHNCEQTIDATFQSLINALGPAITQSEIIIINDASEDSTSKKISHFAMTFPQVRLSSVSFKNIGLVRQHGISLSHGKYITMLDSDDLMKEGTLSSVMQFLHNSQPDMLLTRLHEVRDLSKIDHKWSGFHPEKISQRDTITRFLIHKDLQAHLIGQFIKREIYLAYKIPAMSCYEDFYVFPQMLMAAKSIYFQYDSHYYYIKHQGSLSSTPDHEKIANLIECTQKMEEVFPKAFHHLILCHWLDIFIKHRALLKDTSQRDSVKKHILMTYSPAFFLNTAVRFSYKKKALSTLWKN
ncbi:glycosyltransferase family 2 protein [Dryocola sp. BD613]|uniref:glycosyltransferase family 2 protein n=1 Tax=Dryocola sp. BD613 TaxID=3133272 RepID=UPI003F504596